MNAADEHGIIHAGTCPSPIKEGERPTTTATAGITTAKDTTSSNGSSTDTPTGETTSAPGDDSSLQSKPITDSQLPPSVARSEATSVEGGDGDGDGAIRDSKNETLVAAAVPRAAGEVVRPILLSALQDLSELARPEIAASAVVAGACKVTWLVGDK